MVGSRGRANNAMGERGEGASEDGRRETACKDHKVPWSAARRGGGGGGRRTSAPHNKNSRSRVVSLADARSASRSVAATASAAEAEITTERGDGSRSRRGGAGGGASRRVRAYIMLGGAGQMVRRIRMACNGILDALTFALPLLHAQTLDKQRNATERCAPPKAASPWRRARRRLSERERADVH